MLVVCKLCGEDTCAGCAIDDACAYCRGEAADSSDSSQSDEEDREGRIRVASWNIKTLGKQFLHRHESVQRVFAALLARIDADVIALMEVMEGFGVYTAVKIFELFNRMSPRPWRIRFAGEYTGPGGHNGLETYAVIYDTSRLKLQRFSLVGREISYTRGEDRKRYLDPDGTSATRRPALAVFEPLTSPETYGVFDTIRVVIFHAPSVAPRDHTLARTAIESLSELTEFGSPMVFRHVVLCADLNIDEEAANHVKPRERSRYEDDPVTRCEIDEAEAKTELAIATQKVGEYEEEMRKAAESALRKRRRTAQGAKPVRFTPSTKQKQAMTRRTARMRRAELSLQEAQERLEEVRSGQLDDPREIEVLLAVEDAFEPLASSDMFSRLTYSPDFRTTLRMSLHTVCSRQPRAKFYDDEVSLAGCLYSNFDQVLLRATEDDGWGDAATQVWNLVGAVMPTEARVRIGIVGDPEEILDDDTDEPMNVDPEEVEEVPITYRLLSRIYGARQRETRPVDPSLSELWKRLDEWVEEAKTEAALAVEGNRAVLKNAFRRRKLERAKAQALGNADPGGDYTKMKFEELCFWEALGSRVLELPSADVEQDDSGSVATPFAAIDDPLEDDVLGPFLGEVDVMAAALVGAYKRLVKMNNEHEDIDAIRGIARNAAQEEDPVTAFFDDDVWKKNGVSRATPKSVVYIKPEQRKRFFELNVYLELANTLSDHIPVCVEVEETSREKRGGFVSGGFAFTRPFAPVKTIAPCKTLSLEKAECANIKNCCGTCDERTSAKCSNGCITGYQLVKVGISAIAERYKTINGDVSVNDEGQWVIRGGADWMRVAGRLQQTKSISKSFALDDNFQYFSRHKAIWVGSIRVQVDGCVHCEHKKVCASCGAYWNNKHPRVRFESVPVRGVGRDHEAGDWSYREIGAFFSTRGSDKEAAHALLTLLCTGRLPSSVPDDDSLPYAALLVTMFGVEANKDNEVFVTGLLVLIGIAEGYYSFREVFSDADPKNDCNLAGSLGLFPLASSERSNFFGKRRCFETKAFDTDTVWDEPKIMNAMLDISPREKGDLMLKKDMVVLADWARLSLGAFCHDSTFPLYTRADNGVKRLSDALVGLLKDVYR
ncbi:MAG: hypothetical protein ACRBN8_30695 [Nannocystales bacterium]